MFPQVTCSWSLHHLYYVIPQRVSVNWYVDDGVSRWIVGQIFWEQKHNRNLPNVNLPPASIPPSFIFYPLWSLQETWPHSLWHPNPLTPASTDLCCLRYPHPLQRRINGTTRSWNQAREVKRGETKRQRRTAMYILIELNQCGEGREKTIERSKIQSLRGKRVSKRHSRKWEK